MMSLAKLWDKSRALLGRYKYLGIVVLAGILLLVWPSSSKEEETKGGDMTETVTFSVEDMEKRIADALTQIRGVGQTQVVLTLKTDMEVILSQDESTSQRRSMDGDMLDTYESQTDSKPLTVTSGSNGQQPVVVGRIYPEYKGALIVCEGADNAEVNLRVLEAVASLTGLGTDKITVVPMSKP